ncbi:MAG: 2-amino-4-hydroxy-6-hydroxymethyldihydropteridine diphosphokinase [Burkholderiales bacterium]|nr:2-amino-4-hydroxy-6-hydroxymethyldihydropteridine diphosphokinase [Burkholderiales bacterium]
MPAVYIGIGANLGAAQDSVQQAIARLCALPQTQMQASSGLYSSAPIDAGGDDYINAVVCLETALGAEDLLRHLQAIELAFGRERPYRNAPRTLDLDLLLYGDEQIATTALTVPHPRMTERAFVLLPLLQIAPDIHIPGRGAAQAWMASVAAQRIQIISIN